MKTLLIVRHAKSDWSELGLDDFDRPLNRRGQKDLPRIAGALRRLAPPDQILSSPALRARQTAEHLAAALDREGQLQFDPDLYLAPAGQLARAACGLPDSADTALVVAHNPGLEHWVADLCGAQVRLPTGAIAALTLGTETWQNAKDAPALLMWLLVPRLLKALETD